MKAGSSFNIFTWLQVIGSENIDLLKTVGSEWFESRKKPLNGTFKVPSHQDSKVFCYDVHDAKMVYELYQHSKWNRRHCPNLLCYCSKGEGLAANHSCEFMSHDDHKFFHATSRLKWDALDATSRDALKHRDWADQENWGVTHFGLEPDVIPLDTIRFDTFHMTCAILRKVMGAVRELVNSFSTELRTEFTDEVLRMFWRDFHLGCWNCGFSFNKLQGNELFLFLEHIELVTVFLRRKMGESDRVQQLSDALDLLPKIVKFINTSYIDDSDELYLLKLEQFGKDVRDFVKKGRLTFVIGERDETLYLHVLCHYLPVHAKVNFDRHRLGLGIFTMQGFERRNKESKNCIKRFSTANRKSLNFLVNNVRRLLQVFVHEVNAY